MGLWVAVGTAMEFCRALEVGADDLVDVCDPGTVCERVLYSGAVSTLHQSIKIHTQEGYLVIYYDTDTQYANFRGNPLRQAAKRQLNSSETVKNDDK